MDEFVSKRLAFLRGYPHDDATWVEMFKELAPLIVKELGADNLLDMFMLSIDDGATFDERLNKAWYSATAQQAENSLDWGDDWDSYYEPEPYEGFAAPVDAWRLEDDEAARREQEIEPNVNQEYRAFVRRYRNVWRAGHERRRLKTSHKS
jgi:hypothetical protein